MFNLAKELADIAYIVCGTAVSYGIAPKGSFTLPLANAPGIPVWPKDEIRLTRIEEFKNGFNDYLAAEKADDIIRIENSLHHLLRVVGDTAYVYGFQFAPIFDEVQRSNMSKLDENGKVIKREDGKVLKSSLYSPADIATVVANLQH